MKKLIAAAIICTCSILTVGGVSTYRTYLVSNRMQEAASADSTQNTYWEKVTEDTVSHPSKVETVPVSGSSEETVQEDVPDSRGEDEAQPEEVPAELVPSSVPDQVSSSPTSTYLSELTGLPTSSSLEGQRPVAVMIDNDPRALPHYGLTDADVVYEMVNSLANNRVTRLMGIYKDWQSVQRVGNIRSTRPTNILLAPEWNAVLIHDGGPFYNDPYFQSTGLPHLSGGFSRIRNGKATEFTEYLTGQEAVKRFQKAGYSSAYTENRSHWNFGHTDLSSASGNVGAAVCDLNAFRLTKPSLKYDSSTGLYQYYEQGSLAKDGNTGAVPSFKNVILQKCTYHQYDANGYLIYNIIADKMPGWYLTNGKAIPITWSKLGETDVTKYYDLDGNPITINPGKTYIGIVPDDGWNEVSIR